MELKEVKEATNDLEEKLQSNYTQYDIIVPNIGGVSCTMSIKSKM